MRSAVHLAAVVLLLAVAVTAEVNLREVPRADPLGRRLLYLPSPEALRLASLGNSGLAADLVYLWSIQYYSQYRPAEAFLYLDRVFDIITDLDPHYLDAYRIGAMLFEMEAAGNRQAAADAVHGLYAKGLAANPESWELAEIAAWDAYLYFRDLESAIRYMEVAASRPDAPARLKRVLGRWRDRAGAWSLADSAAYWRDVVAEASNPAERGRAESALYDVEVRIDRQRLDPLLAEWVRVFGSCPRSWDELEASGWLDAPPLDPWQTPYEIDPDGCTILALKKLRR